MVAVYLSANLGMMWIFVEATTLASALLVGFYNTEGAVEAGWKYLIVCTVGIAFALFGTIALYLAAVKGGVSPQSALDWGTLMAAAPGLVGGRELLKLAFVFVAVGYGTKVGFVPMHSWLPDAHAEAPSPISALLSAVLLNCAMYALLRFDAITSRAIGSGFSHTLLLIFGGVSLAVASLLMIVQRDLKRLLAYSSIEHMGIVAIGIGLGGALGLYGALLHTFNHSIAKTFLFFTAGNVQGKLRHTPHGAHSRHGPFTALDRGCPYLGRPRHHWDAAFWVVCQRTRDSHRGFLDGTLFHCGANAGSDFRGLWRAAPPFPAHAHGRAGGCSSAPALPASWFVVMGVCTLCLAVLGVHIPAAFAAVLRGAMAVLQAMTVTLPNGEAGVARALDLLRAANTRLVSIFGSTDDNRVRRVHYLIDVNGSEYRMLSSPVTGPIPSATPITPAAAWYERELHDQYGIECEGHPDPRPLLFHENWPENVHPMIDDVSNVPWINDRRPVPLPQSARGRGLRSAGRSHTRRHH